MNQTTYANETNGLNGSNIMDWLDSQGEMGSDVANWYDPSVESFLRVRLLTDPGYPEMDVSYCFVRTKDGKCCRCHSVPGQNGLGGLNRRSWKSDAVKEAREHNRYLKGMNFFEAVSVLY